LLPKLGVDINNLNLTDLQSLLPEAGIDDGLDLEKNPVVLLILALLALGYTLEQLRELIPEIQLGPRPELDPNAPNTANQGFDEAIDKILQNSNAPGTNGNINELAEEFIPYFASQRGRQGDAEDTGIRNDAQERINRDKADGKDTTMEKALNDLMNEAKRANDGKGDKKRMQRIKAEQKAQKIRQSRQSKD
jgi:hypothetical protein